MPDWRNRGVILRLLIGANLLGLGVALAQAPDLAAWLPLYVELSFRLQPALLVVVVVLAALRDPLWRLRRAAATGAVIVVTVLVALGLEAGWSFLGLAAADRPTLLRSAVLAAAAAGVLLAYFALRARAAGPASAEARLAALTARIRPHFLFNSLNAVLSLIRVDPRRAETALESLAELFRELMRDPQDLTPLSAEIALCRQYLELERLRLGERLQVAWDIADVPGDARLPPLMLQPLLENAVYHGIEPAAEGGTLGIRFARREGFLVIEISNPRAAGNPHGAGNRMALANIRERLALHYDLEARLDSEERDGVFRVSIALPYREA